MAVQKQFNKVNAFDELAVLMNPGPNPKMSESISALQRAQDYLQQIHDEAFKQGFESGLDVSEKKFEDDNSK